MQLPQEIIRRKRDGETLDRETLTAFIEGLTRGDISDAQAAAFAMAIFFRGLSPGECAGLTLAMARSGLVL
ncbi:MAG TPA: thymidine phosphorylase, partial [Beijerinckia sp.]|nr:thymidine phosphorylase [Beijerinckia sp.]